MDLDVRPIHSGQRVGLELSRRQIVLKNEEGDTKEVAPLVYVVWRKCNSENTVNDLIEYCVDRTRKSKEFISGIVFDILKDLKNTGFLEY
ncbi:MAG: hypothetical protein HWN67_06290 [Candidatus Helarchaeota archaeon]|nr:hypothetical protein [Candidatus Helarchaeota archaeon]